MARRSENAVKNAYYATVRRKSRQDRAPSPADKPERAPRSPAGMQSKGGRPSLKRSKAEVQESLASSVAAEFASKRRGVCDVEPGCEELLLLIRAVDVELAHTSGESGTESDGAIVACRLSDGEDY